MEAIAPAVASTRHIRLSRRLASIVGWTFSGACLVVLGVLMVWILSVVFVRGIGALNIRVLTTITRGSGGGLLNAIEGTLLLSGAALLLAIPFGVAAGIYSAEYRFTAWAVVIRFLADVLVGVPSIVIGYFGYVALVQWLGWNFSLAAGAIALAIISLPYICRTTELALRQVSNDLRDAAYSLGANERRVIFGVCLPAALPSILTGVLLALAVSVGETAPLLYTAGWSNFMWDGHLTHSPVGYLTYAIWTFINEPFASANALAYAAALLVTGFVLIINILARFLLERRRIQR
jgi:phosphate transport system permease protein